MCQEQPMPSFNAQHACLHSCTAGSCISPAARCEGRWICLCKPQGAGHAGPVHLSAHLWLQCFGRHEHSGCLGAALRLLAAPAQKAPLHSYPAQRVLRRSLCQLMQQAAGCAAQVWPTIGSCVAHLQGAALQSLSPVALIGKSCASWLRAELLAV